MTKKLSILGLIIGLFLVVSPVYAQEAPATLTLQQQYQQALVTLIGLLQQQIAALETQLQAIVTSQQAIQTQITQAQIQPLPIVTQPIFGSTPMQDKSDMTIQYLGISPALPGMPFGRAELSVSVLDKDGNPARTVEVKMSAPNSITQGTSPEDFDRFTNLTGYVGFNWIPSQQGTTTITFTSGNLVRTIDVMI